MSLKKVLLSTVAAATLTSGLVASVTVTPNHIGNNLKFPTYFAVNSANWKTNFRVTNTNGTKSIVAKVVIREGKQSAEKLDFLIYLSPFDVFDATIEQVGSKVVVTTYDDSLDLIYDVASNSRVNQTADGQGITIDLVQDYTAPDSIGQNSTYGYIEVYGLMESNSTDANYTNAGTPATVKTISKAFNEPGVVHDEFVAAATGVGPAVLAGDNIDRKVTATMATDWNDVSGGLTGTAVIFSNNPQGKFAMQYTAVALQDSIAGAAAGVSEDKILPANQRGEDTNFLAWNSGVQLIEDIENALAKTATYVTHYSKSTNPATKANAVSDMVETRLITNFITKKYSVEMWNNYAQTNANPSVTDTHGIHSAGGNLFYPTARTTVNSAITDTEAKKEIVQRYVNVGASKHDHFEYKAGGPTGDGTSGTIPGEAPSAIKPCKTEVCLIDLDSNKVDGEVSDQDITNFGDGFVTMTFEGALDRNASDKISTMPYIPMVMTGITVDGTNLTNISYPAYTTGDLNASRNGGATVAKYANADGATNKYDWNTEIGVAAVTVHP